MNSRTVNTGVVVGLLLMMSAAAMAAVPVRGASKNGTNSSQPNMNLFGPTRSAPKNSVGVGVAVQYICPNQDVADSDPGNFTDVDPNAPDTLKLAGSCTGGLYKFLVQAQPLKLKTSLRVTFNNLVGFTPATDDSDFNNPTYGAQLCDTGGNTLELCTNLAEGDLPVINTEVNAKHTRVSFTIKNVGPTTVPAGIDYEGQGFTFFVLVQLTPKTPIAVPKIDVD